METNKVREKLIEVYTKSLEENVVPWRRTWTFESPVNPVTGKKYRGINFLVLKSAELDDPRWMTFNQAKQQKWNVKKGEKGTTVEFWSIYDTETKKSVDFDDYNDLPLEEKLTAKFKLNVKYYTVFNAKQIENIPAYVKVQNPIKLNDIEEKFLPKLIKNMEVEVVHNNGGKAYYAPLQDKVCLPFKENFEDGYSYSATLLHELGHATGNKKRLDRDLTGRFGSESYAKEELRAEIAASFVAGELNLDPNKAVDDENHKAYIQGWVKFLKDKPNELFKAISDAQKIANYLEEKGELKLMKKNIKDKGMER